MHPDIRRASGILVLFLLSLYALTFRGIYAGDNLYHYAQVESIIGRRSLSLPLNSLLQTERGFSPFFAYGRDGKPYLTLPPGLSAASLPFGLAGTLVAKITGNSMSTVLASGISADHETAIRAVAKTPQAMITAFVNPVAMAVLVLLFFLFCFHLSGAFRRSLLLSVVLGCCTIIWPYSSNYWTQPVTTLCLFGALYMLVRGSGERMLLPSGMVLGFAVLARYEAALFLPFYLYYILRCEGGRIRGRWKPVAVFLAGFAAPISLLLLWNMYRFGSITDTGAGHQRMPAFTWNGNLFQSIPSLLIGPNRSIFLYSPPLILGLMGFRQFWSRYRVMAVTVAGCSIAAILMYGRFSFWFAPISWGPRFLVILTPFLLLPTSLMEFGTGRRRALLRYLALAGLFIQLIAIIVPYQLQGIDSFWSGCGVSERMLIRTDILPQFLGIFRGQTEFWWTGSTATVLIGVGVFIVLFMTGRRLIWLLFRRRSSIDSE